MQIMHRLVGYDRQTDRMRLRFDIPDRLMPEVKNNRESLQLTIPTPPGPIR